MSAWAKMIAVLCAAAMFALTVRAQKGVDAARVRDLEEHLLYLPNEELLDHFTAGMTSIVADLLWLRCVGYTGRHVRTDQDFTWMQRMIQTVVRLDPYFVDAYLNGAIFMTSLQSDHRAAIALLEQGFAKNPHAWELAHQIAMIHLVDRRDAYGSDRLALHYLTLAAGTGNAPDHVADLASKLQSDYDQFDIEEEMWTRILNEGDRLKRELAERKLIELDVRRACRALTKAVDTFRAQAGRPPTNLDALVAAGLIGGVPDDPLGGSFFIDFAGQVRSTTLLDSEKEHRLGRLRIAIGQYRENEGCWPPNLEDLVETKRILEIPAHPYPGQVWRYDPHTGRIE